MVAAQNDSFETAECLFEEGADKEIRDRASGGKIINTIN
jgi:hypothetical protein